MPAEWDRVWGSQGKGGQNVKATLAYKIKVLIRCKEHLRSVLRNHCVGQVGQEERLHIMTKAFWGILMAPAQGGQNRRAFVQAQ